MKLNFSFMFAVPKIQGTFTWLVRICKMQLDADKKHKAFIEIINPNKKV